MIRHLILLLIWALAPVTSQEEPRNSSAVGQDEVCHPVRENYEKEGKIWNLGDLPIYETGTEGPLTVILAYDIFGFHPNMFQVADKLGREGGFKVVIPDYFRGVPCPEDKRPKDMSELLTYVMAMDTNWDRTVMTDTKNAIAHYKNTQGANSSSSFAIAGFCWGGLIAARAAGDMSSEFKAAAVIHPVGVTEEHIRQIGTPTYLMPALGDVDMTGYYQILQQKLGPHCGYKLFNDVLHGFSSSRGNFSDPLIQTRVEEVVALTKDFFNENK